MIAGDACDGCGNWGLRDALWVSLAQAGALVLCPNYLSLTPHLAKRFCGDSAFCFPAISRLLRTPLVQPPDAENRTSGGVGGCVKKARKRHAVRMMKVDPSEPSCRGRLLTAMSCFGQKPRW